MGRHYAEATRKAVILLVVILPLVATVYAITLLWNRLVSWQDLALLAGMYVATGLGITVGYHRMLTHRGFDAPEPVRFIFLALGSASLQGPCVEWAATHVKHHAKADQEGDPHSPLHGFWHAHFGWLIRDPLIKDGVWAKPFEKDRTAHFVNNTWFVWAGLGLLIPFAIGGWTGLLWGGLVRIFLLHHVTWSVNSVCHTFGWRDYETKDASRNEPIVGLLALGEGWHNNHHASPRTAIHGFKWWQIDGSGYLIRAMARLGIARNVVRDKPARRVVDEPVQVPGDVPAAESRS
jgi:stearoyl-CoA desaturase (Delta-9 desaturase)